MRAAPTVGIPSRNLNQRGRADWVEIGVWVQGFGGAGGGGVGERWLFE